MLTSDIGKKKFEMIQEVAKREGVDEEAALALVVTAGLRHFRTKHRISCGFAGCTRSDCCGGWNRDRTSNTVRLVREERG